MCTVVQVALEPPALLVAGLDDAHARCLHLGELEPNLDAKSGHLDREPGSREHAVEQVATFVQRRVVREHGRAHVVATDLPSRADIERKVDELAACIGVGLRLGEPEEELGKRVAECFGEHGADLLRCAASVADVVLEGTHQADTVVARTAKAPVHEILDACS